MAVLAFVWFTLVLPESKVLQTSYPEHSIIKWNQISLRAKFGSKTVFLGQEVHFYMVYIAYFTELILQICDFAQKRRI